MIAIDWHAVGMIVFYMMAAAALVQILYYAGMYSGVFSLSRAPAEGAEKPVSVIIAARNETENLQKFLPGVLEQEYKEYEVIVVDDASTDNSYDMLSEMKVQYPHLRITHVPYDPKYHIGKKMAITIGVKAAKYEHLLFTDADCQPQSPRWLQHMQRHFVQGKDFVVGYGGYFRRFGILNRFIRYDAAFIAMQYLTFALRGMPYMGVGRNMGYTKNLFFRHAGFSGSLHLRWGDDDLFVNKLARSNNVAPEASREAFVMSEPASTFRAWRKQKQRHMETSAFYKLRDKMVLFLEPFSRVVFYLAFILLLFLPVNILWVLGVFVLRLLMQQVVFIKWFSWIREAELLIYSVLLDFLMPWVHFIFLLSNRFVKHYRWD